MAPRPPRSYTGRYSPNPPSHYGGRCPPAPPYRPISDGELSDEDYRAQHRSAKKRDTSISPAPAPVTITYDKDGHRVNNVDQDDATTSAPPDVLWRLAIHRRKGDDKKGRGLDHRVTYIAEKPFDVKLSSDEDAGLTSVRGSSANEPSQRPVFEVITEVLDSRFTLKDEKRDADVSDLQISRVYGENIKIWSASVRKALASMVEYYPEYPPHKFEKPLEVYEPYALLMHHFDSIDALASAGLAQSNGNESAAENHKVLIKHMTVLRDFLKVQYET